MMMMKEEGKRVKENAKKDGIKTQENNKERKEAGDGGDCAVDISFSFKNCKCQEHCEE